MQNKKKIKKKVMPLMRLPGHMAGISPAGDSKKIAKENSIKVIES